MDTDLALALSLQFDEESELSKAFKANGSFSSKEGLNGSSSNLLQNIDCSSINSKPLSIVDEAWELIDPIPDIHDLFLQFNDAFFGGRLAGVEVKWSARMTLCAGLCLYQGRGGYCSIRLSQPLLKLRPRKDLVQTLLHEMIHAVLFVTHNNKDHDSHGPEFHKHMYRINKQTGANITVYHNFHDEVNNYRQHWWKCDGPCKTRPPFYGIVRRAMNRAPSKNDTWWSEHMRTCGGNFVKIKEPDDYGKNSKRKREKVSESDSGKSEENEQKTAKFPGKGKSLIQENNEKISKWFKPSSGISSSNVEVLDAAKDQNMENSPKKKDNVSNVDKANGVSGEIANGNKSSELASAVFSGSGRVLGGEKASFLSIRDAWLDKLTKRHQNPAKSKRNGESSVSVNPWSIIERRKAIEDDEVVPKETVSEQNENLKVDESAGAKCLDGCNESACATVASEKGPSSSKKGLINDKLVPSSGAWPTSLAGSFRVISREVTEESSFSGTNKPDLSVGLSNKRKRTRINEEPDKKPSTFVLDDSFDSQEKLTELVECPVCPKRVPSCEINKHLDECLPKNS